jgi:hypothetical protein
VYLARIDDTHDSTNAHHLHEHETDDMMWIEMDRLSLAAWPRVASSIELPSKPAPSQFSWLLHDNVLPTCIRMARTASS